MASANYFCHFIRRIVLAAAIFCPAFSAMAQSSATYQMEAKALYDGNSVILRWAPKDYATWNWANLNNGYDVERTSLKLNNVPLTTTEVAASKVVIATGLDPLPEMDWEAFPDTNMAGIVAGSIYGDSIEVVDMANADFMTVVNTNEARQNRFGFSLFACDQNFDIALAAGLAWVDTTVVAEASYIYVIKLHTLPAGTTQKKGVTIINTNAENIPAPPKPSAQGGNLSVILLWEKQNDYSSFIVERSDNNGLTYLPLNDKPFVSLAPADAAGTMATFMDSLSSNDISYIYRVRGLTPFGITGPPSDTVHAGGVPAPLAEAPYINHVAENQSGQMGLNWEFPVNLESVITQFEIHRSANIDGDYQMLGTALPNQRSYTDNSPLSINYYTVKSKDLNGKYAVSLPKMGQADDEQAPAAPTGLSGSCDNNGLVTISWLPNTEEDLKGYRVYTSDQNIVDTAFAQITPDPIRDTFFQYQVPLNSLTDNMYFAVKAADFRENTSPSSIYLNIERTDAVAPSAPSITNVLPLSDAVQLSVTNSPSNDVVRYEFQKRWEGSPDWVVLATFPTAQMVTSYKDSLTYLDPVLRRRWYYYRLVAFDEADLSVSSQMIRTKPVDQGIRAAVQNLTAQLQINGPTKKVLLQWSYPPDVDLAGFQIYRAIDNSQMRSFKFVPITNVTAATGVYSYLDTDTKLKTIPQQGVFVQPPLVPGGATTTIVPLVVNKPANIGNNAFITLKYQVMAVFFDGAQSPMSITVQVVFQ